MAVGVAPVQRVAAAVPAPAVEQAVGRSVPVQGLAAEASRMAPMPVAEPTPPVWPTAGSTVVDVPATSGRSVRAVVGGLPVVVSDVAVASQGRLPAEDVVDPDRPSRVQVSVVERATSAEFGAPVAVAVSRADGGRGGRVRLEVDYSGFATGLGANWGWRVGLVALPGCALTTPKAPECSVPVVLASSTDGARSRVSAVVDFDRFSSVVAEQPASSDRAPAAEAVVGRFGVVRAVEPEPVDLGSGVVVVALVAGAQSEVGDFRKTDMRASGEWNAGGGSGDFSWSYPLTVPPVPGGLVPSLVLSYSSGSVDGQTSGGNGQPGMFGQGWSYSPGYVERTYRTCSQDTANSPYWTAMNTHADLCWRLPNAQINLNGKVSEIVKGDDGVWRLAQDDGEKVELIVGGAGQNADPDGEYWRVTTTDGTQYWFGRSTMPDGKEASASVAVTPVYANHSGEPCFTTSSGPNSVCFQAWRWMLDYVVDRHGNEMIFYYGKETNQVGLYGNTGWQTTYDRAIYPTRIDYGLRAGQAGPAAARVVFTNSDRCFTGSCSTHDGANWPDTPWDLYCPLLISCTNNMAPSYWTSKRVSKIETQVRTGSSAYSTVDEWALGESFPAPGDNMGPELWLDSITRTGHKTNPTSSVTLPSVSFHGVSLQNRADYNPSGGMASHMKYRIDDIYTETGGKIHVSYSGDDTQCVFGGSFPDPDNNPRRCYPQMYTNPSGSTGWAWWHKRVVTQVTENDLVGGSPPVVHDYAYGVASSTSNVLWSHQDGASVWSSPLANRSWSTWRGYSNVTVTTGPAAGPRQQTDSVYFRGLDGDMLDSGNRSVNLLVWTATGTTPIADSPGLAGRQAQTTVYPQAGGSAEQFSTTIPYLNTTGTRTLSTSWAIPNVGRSYLARDATSTRYEYVSGGWSARTQTTKAWNPTLGRLISVQDEGSLPASGDTTCTWYTYTDNTSAYMYSYVSDVRVQGTDCGRHRPDENLLTETRYFYDLQSTFGAAPIAGNVSRTERCSSVIPITHSCSWAVHTKDVAHDGFGRVTSATDALNRTTATAYTQNTYGLTTTVAVTNPLSQTTTTTLDPWRGQPLTATDANTKTTTGVYDALGRLTSVTKPGNTTAFPDLAYAYGITKTGPSSVQTLALGPNGNQISSYEIYDGLLRPRQTQTTAPDGNRVITDTSYNEYGLPAVQSTFYNNQSGPTSTLVTFNVDSIDRQTRTAYDGRLRPTVLAQYSAGVEKWHTTTSYAWDRTTVIPPTGGIVTQQVLDDLGRTTEQRQYESSNLNGPYTATTYGYNLRGELTTVADAADNHWTYTYDLRGRRTHTADPDAGDSYTAYDDAGQIATTTDGNGTVLAYAYDTLGRRTEVHEGSLAGPKRAEWHYDTLAKGQLDWTIRYDGGLAYKTETTAYDNGYRPLGTTVTIPASATNANLADTYTTTMTYKASGALETMSLPAAGGLPAETITYTYTNQGLPSTTTGLDAYVAATAYRWDGAIDYTLHGTSGYQVRQDYDYDEPTGRLASQTVLLDNPANPGTFTPAYATGYTYDQAGNITALQATTSGTNDRRECFSYDYLQRLTEAWTETSACGTPQRTGADPYHRAWTFDTIGNRLTQTDYNSAGDTTWTYHVGAAASVDPHQLGTITATGPLSGTPTRTFTYNTAGQAISQTSDAGAAQTLTWDPEGHLATLTENSQTTSYLYDPDGNRLIARDPTTTTLYLGTTELAMPTGGGTVTGTRYYGATAVRTSSGLTWAIADHEGTNTIQIDAVTLQTQRLRRLPYGEPYTTPPLLWTGTKGYVGGTQDPTGLTHLGAREYDPTTGRFTSLDPLMDLADPQQWNGYSYANNNPITRSDPSGLCIRSDDDLCISGGNKERGKIVTNGSGHDVTEGDIHYLIFVGPVILDDTVENQRVLALFNKKLAEDPDDYARTFDQVGLLVNICESPGFHCDESEMSRLYDLDMQMTMSHSVEAMAMGAAAEGMLSLATAPMGGLGAGGMKLGALPAADAAMARAFNSRQRSGGGCLRSFSAGTPVLMADGSAKRIDAITVGDRVVSTDPESGHTQLETVLATWVHDDTLMDLVLADGEKLTTTDDHQLWNATDHEWQEAREFDRGDRLLTTKGAAAVLSLDWFSAHTGDAYNLTVADLHAYYVLAGQTPVLVHNCPEKIEPTSGKINWEDPSISPGEGWEWRGSGPPGSDKGAWFKSETRETLHPDLTHPDPIGPHWDYRAPDGTFYRVYPDGTVVPK